MANVIEKYYRVNPLKGSFPSFVNALSTDPDLLNKKLIQKSDSSNYFLRGDYKVFNPFSINAYKVEMVFTEQQVELTHKNTLHEQTVYTYQILAYFDDTESNRKLVVKDYNKIKKQFGKMMGSQISSLKGFKNINDGEIADFFYGGTVIYPITISWQTLSKSKHIALTMITKLVVENNRAALAGGPLFIVLKDDALPENLSIEKLPR